MEMQLSGKGKKAISANSTVLIHFSVKVGTANVPQCEGGHYRTGLQ